MNDNRAVFEIEPRAYRQIIQALQDYGDYEIGGLLIGYRKGRNSFAISEATVANDVGEFSITNFIREPFKSVKKILKAFKKMDHNYLGEWHSHPRFALYPSNEDISTMQGILSDPNYGVNFVLLIITKLENEKALMAGYLFHNRLINLVQQPIPCRLQFVLSNRP